MAIRIKPRLITHAGCYHADDVMSTAFLEILLNREATYEENPEAGSRKIQLIRINKIEDVEVHPMTDIVYDIGFGEFDHHQKNKPIRPNGIPYAAFGLLWQRYACANGIGFTRVIMEMVDEDFVQYIDQTDNGGQQKFPNPLSALISANASMKVDFLDTVHQIKPMLEMLIASYKKLSDEREEIESKIYSSPDGIETKIFAGHDTHYDARAFRGTNVKYVTGPSNRGQGYVLRSLDSENYPIMNVSGVEPIFIHPGRFTATYASEQDAIVAAEFSLEGSERQKEMDKEIVNSESEELSRIWKNFS